MRTDSSRPRPGRIAKYQQHHSPDMLSAALQPRSEKDANTGNKFKERTKRGSRSDSSRFSASATAREPSQAQISWLANQAQFSDGFFGPAGAISKLLNIGPLQ